MLRLIGVIAAAFGLMALLKWLSGQRHTNHAGLLDLIGLSDKLATPVYYDPRGPGIFTGPTDHPVFWKRES